MKLLLLLIIGSLSLFSEPIHKINLLAYGGLPEYTKEIKVLYNTAFITGYSESLKQPLWTCYRLGNYKGEFTDQKWERPPKFFIDRRTSSLINHDAYTGSGYDRGHMAPNAAILSNYGQMAQLETYLMSNISPQSPKLNRGLWQELESHIRDTISQIDTKNQEVKNVYIITGPVFEKGLDNFKMLKNSDIPIPSHFYKIVLFNYGYNGTKRATSFLFPQEPRSNELSDYLTTIDKIEELTDLNFFNELSDRKQKNLESIKRNFRFETLR